jgi:hypothetical protein
MTDKRIEPALTADEWADAQKYGADAFRAEAGPRTWFSLPQVIALANAALPDSDPRKITREKIAQLRLAVNEWDGVGRDPVKLAEWQGADDDRPEPDLEYFGGGDAALAFLDALESYLPPEER